LRAEGQSSLNPSREELLQLYKIAVDEYRFQVQLNWQRSQYYLILNAALVAAGGSLLGVQGDRARPLAAVLFWMGLLTVVLSLLASTTQHSYYRAARAVLKRFEERLGLDDLAIQTTPAMGSKHYRIGTVRNFQRSMLVMLGLIDFAGLAYSARSFGRAVAYIWQSWF
jgi:hypothetical protein